MSNWYRRFASSSSSPHSKKKRPSLVVEPLEGRCTPSATPWDLGLLALSADGLFSDPVFGASAPSQKLGALANAPAPSSGPAGIAATPVTNSSSGDGAVTPPLRAAGVAGQAVPAGLLFSTSGPAPAALSMSWLNFGPTAAPNPDGKTVAGRVTGVAVDPADPTGNTVYIAAAGGGIWLSTNAQSASPTWTPLTDGQSTLFMGSIAMINPGSAAGKGGTGIIYAGTGEPDNDYDSSYGRGVLISRDGGATWTLSQGNSGTNEFYRRQIGKVVIDPTDTTGNTAYVAVSDSGAPGLNGVLNNNALPGNTGIWKTTNGGQTWTDTTQGITGPFANSQDNFCDLAIDPTNHLHLLAAVGAKQSSQHPGIYETYDGGNTWTASGNFPTQMVSGQLSVATPTAANVGRIGLTFTPNGLAYATVAYSAAVGEGTVPVTGASLNFFAATFANGSAASTSWNFTFKTKAVADDYNFYAALKLAGAIHSQGFFDMALLADPLDSSGQTLYLLGTVSNLAGSYVFQSKDGGTSWTRRTSISCASSSIAQSAKDAKRTCTTRRTGPHRCPERTRKCPEYQPQLALVSVSGSSRRRDTPERPPRRSGPSRCHTTHGCA